MLDIDISARRNQANVSRWIFTLSSRNYEVKLSPLLLVTEFNSAFVRKPFCINLFLANVINRDALRGVTRVYVCMTTRACDYTDRIFIAHEWAFVTGRLVRVIIFHVGSRGSIYMQPTIFLMTIARVRNSQRGKGGSRKMVNKRILNHSKWHYSMIEAW